MSEFCHRGIWIGKDGEKREAYIRRLELQHEQFRNIKRSRGQCYIIRFGEDDTRPMWEHNIAIQELKKQIRTPYNTEWDCPLCQPYDNWEGIATIEKNRNYMCRVINPRYNNGTIEEGGTLQKCPCISKPKHRQHLKFKK